MTAKKSKVLNAQNQPIAYAAPDAPIETPRESPFADIRVRLVVRRYNLIPIYPHGVFAPYDPGVAGAPVKDKGQVVAGPKVPDGRKA